MHSISGYLTPAPIKVQRRGPQGQFLLFQCDLSTQNMPEGR